MYKIRRSNYKEGQRLKSIGVNQDWQRNIQKIESVRGK